MIPKLIHLFWFGGNEKSALIKRCIESWRTFAPEYRIMKWDEANFDVNFCRRSRQAYEAGKYAFVADIARLKVLYEQGGIYLDTDVELTAPLDELISQTRGAKAYFLFLSIKTLIISKKPGNTGKSRDKDTEFTTHLLHSEGALTRCPFP